MSSSDFLIICGTGLGAVFALLMILAILMRFLIWLFPGKELTQVDSHTVASIVSCVNQVYPGTRVTRIERAK